jgi:hypothetical protein
MTRNFVTLCFLAFAGAAVCAAGVQTSPVPEPGSIILLGTAAAGIGYAA